MKFLVKDSKKQIPEGMKEIDINVPKITFASTVGLYLFSMTEVGNISLFADKIITPLTKMSSMPLTTICGSILLATTTSLIIPHLIDDYHKQDKKNNQQIEVEKEVLMLFNKMKKQAMAIQGNKKEEK